VGEECPLDFEPKVPIGGLAHHKTQNRSSNIDWDALNPNLHRSVSFDGHATVIVGVPVMSDSVVVPLNMKSSNYLSSLPTNLFRRPLSGLHNPRVLSFVRWTKDSLTASAYSAVNSFFCPGIHDPINVIHQIEFRTFGL
jgi:hypothetical protein